MWAEPGAMDAQLESGLGGAGPHVPTVQPANTRMVTDGGVIIANLVDMQTVLGREADATIVLLGNIQIGVSRTIIAKHLQLGIMLTVRGLSFGIGIGDITSIESIVVTAGMALVPQGPIVPTLILCGGGGPTGNVPPAGLAFSCRATGVDGPQISTLAITASFSMKG